MSQLELEQLTQVDGSNLVAIIALLLLAAVLGKTVLNRRR